MNYSPSFDEIETNSEFADIALGKHPSITIDSLVSSEGLPDTVVDQINLIVQSGLYDDNPEGLGKRSVRRIIKNNREKI